MGAEDNPAGPVCAGRRPGARCRGMSATTPNLTERLPTGPVTSDDLLDIFVDWAADRGLELYPAQEEAIL